MSTTKLEQMHGVLVINKPKGPTSTACITRIKRELQQKKIGHGGTLDPMAEGVLLVLLGQGTKLSNHLLADGEKVYAATVELGMSTDTWDAEGTIVSTADWSAVRKEDVVTAVHELLNITEQLVPAYSAAKHKGTPLYALARRGEATPEKIKAITIFRVELIWCELPRFHFRVSCSSGTYIRSLAHSLGTRLGCGGTLTELTREYSHPFGLDTAYSLETVLSEPERLHERVVSFTDALPQWPKLLLDTQQEALIRNGAFLPYRADDMAGLQFMTGVKALAIDSQNAALALVETHVYRQEQVWSVIRGLWN